MKEQFVTETNTGPGNESITEPAHGGPHILSTRSCLWVWAGLMVLTAITVGVSEVDLGFLHVLAAMIIATIKAALVVFWFMHIKYEGAAIRWMLFTAFLILAILISFTFFDVLYR